MAETPEITTFHIFPKTETIIPIEYEITKKLGEICDFVRKHIQELAQDMNSIGILTGDRISCCDEAVLAKNEDQEVVGVCTMSARGEGSLANLYDKDPKELAQMMMDDIQKFMRENWNPTIVGRVVLPEYRRKKIGENLYLQAINRMQERMKQGELPKKKIRVDHVSRSAKLGMEALIKKYPELNDILEVYDLSLPDSPFFR